MSLYDIDLHPRLVLDTAAAGASEPPAKKSKGKAPAKGAKSKAAPTSMLFSVALEDLERYGTKLGHRDVCMNMGNCAICIECREETSGLRACDGCFPICAGTSYPVDGRGAQHACHRAVICEECVELSRSRRTASWSLIEKNRVSYWLCPACTAGSENYLDVWGSDAFTEPTLNIRPGTVHPTAHPTPKSAPAVQPCEVADAAHRSRLQQAADAARQFASAGGAFAVQGAAIFMRTVRRAFMPRTQQVAVLDVIHELHDTGVIRFAQETGHTGDLLPPCPLPRDIRTVERHAAAAMVVDSDVDYNVVTMNMENLQQQQQECHVHIADLASCIQSLLLDSRFDADSRVFPASDVPRTYTDESGQVLQGPELFHGSQWTQYESTIPPGGRLLFLIVHSDKTSSMRGSKYPFRIQLGNVCLDERTKDPGSRVVGFGPLINIYRTRGSKTHAKLNDSQASAKRALYAAAPAHMFADLNEIARTMTTFSLYMPAGNTRVSVHIRIGLICADYEEKKAIYAIQGMACARCCFLKPAIDAETAEGRDKKKTRKPYMRPDFACAIAQPRTVSYVVGLQAEAASMARCGASKADVAEKVQFTGVAPDTQCMLQRLDVILPHEIGAPYITAAVDFLHSFLLGFAKKIVLQIDAYILKVHRKDGDFKSPVRWSLLRAPWLPWKSNITVSRNR